MMNNPWLIDNKNWLEQRKKDWLFIESRVKRMTGGMHGIDNEALPNYKDLFIYGTLRGHPVFTGSVVNPELNHSPGRRNDETNYKVIPERILLNFSKAYGSQYWPLFFIWFHPKPDLIDIAVLLNEALSTCNSMYMLRTGFHEKFLRTVDYGKMGGREEYIAQFLGPTYKYNDMRVIKLKFSSGEDRQNVGSGGLAVRPSVIAATETELAMDARFAPYSLGQYYWKHLSHALEYNLEDLFDFNDINELEKNKRYLKLKRIVVEILNFENRTDKSTRRPSTIAMIERVMGYYERKEFSDRMLILWESAKKDFKKLIKKNTLRFYENPEQLNSAGDFPPEAQEELIAQWKLI